MSDELNKAPGKTQLFQEHLQAIFADVVGERCSKQVVWDLYKAFLEGTNQFVLAQDDKTLSLSGVGKFKVNRSKATKEDGTVVIKPRYRMYPSSRIKDYTDRLCGVAPLAPADKMIGKLAGTNIEEAVTKNAAWLATAGTDTEEEE